MVSVTARRVGKLHKQVMVVVMNLPSHHQFFPIFHLSRKFNVQTLMFCFPFLC